MFEQFKLVMLLRAAHDCCLVAQRTLNESDGEESNWSTPEFGSFSVCQIAEVCEPLMFEYARQIPRASALRQRSLERIPRSQLNLEMTRTYGTLIKSARRWLTTVSPQRQWNTLVKVYGANADLATERVVALVKRLDMIESMRWANAT